MTASTGTSQAGVSIHEAAVLLGVSPNTVRRWCAMGRLRSERLPRPQGATIRVYLDGAARQVSTEVPPGEVPRDVPIEVPLTSHGQVPAEEERSQTMATWAASLLVPIAAELGEARQTIERQAGEVAELREQRGRLTVEVEQARGMLGELQGRYGQAVTFARRVTVVLTLLTLAVMLAIVGALAPSWVR